jgi:hypothetical protein
MQNLMQCLVAKWLFEIALILLPLQALGAPIDNYNRYLKGASCSPNPLSPEDRLQIILPHGHLPQLRVVNPVGDWVDVTYSEGEPYSKGRINEAQFALMDRIDLPVKEIQGFNSYYYATDRVFHLNGFYRFFVQINPGEDGWKSDIICDVNYFDPSDHRPALASRRLYRSDGD